MKPIINKEKIIVSACLLGDKCTYKASDNYNEKVIEYLKDYDVIKVCPEVLGGLSVPRTPCEICENKVIDQNGENKTLEYELGAKKVLELANKYHIRKAILKSKSPSCGTGEIYDGTFTHRIVKGDGICAKALKEANIEVINSDKIGND